MASGYSKKKSYGRGGSSGNSSYPPRRDPLAIYKHPVIPETEYGKSMRTFLQRSHVPAITRDNHTQYFSHPVSYTSKPTRKEIHDIVNEMLEADDKEIKSDVLEVTDREQKEERAEINTLDNVILSDSETYKNKDAEHTTQDYEISEETEISELASKVSQLKSETELFDESSKKYLNQEIEMTANVLDMYMEPDVDFLQKKNNTSLSLGDTTEVEGC